MGVDCSIAQFLPGVRQSAFLPLQYFIAIHSKISKMHDGELVTFPELANRRAFVLVIVHPCEMECCGTVGVSE